MEWNGMEERNGGKRKEGEGRRGLRKEIEKEEWNEEEEWRKMEEEWNGMEWKKGEDGGMEGGRDPGEGRKGGGGRKRGGQRGGIRRKNQNEWNGTGKRWGGEEE
ncbi:hypothetical protein H6P81_018289 [Aristolochia fimbriata]|uniref:Uncharacterized protein n=1 Tax=Aristolochia fimbriata TaxID=158543 RepID=A0AAV7E2P4_ARIFI|nr:hypothetical protein H6P81_018289 [Aristolochia fimbriata]